ncbi:MAG: aminotransferase class I/II-fold pyridoxal phosphate-dependent enzyme [Oscillospiraceae bacterium]
MLYDIISGYTSQDICPMHMPGHKRNTGLLGEGLPYKIDITEINGFDNLHNTTGILKETAGLACALYGSRKSFLLINGSTGGILAAVRGTVRRGDKIIMARNCHKSVFHAVELCGLMTAYIVPENDAETGIQGSIAPEQVKSALDKNQDAKLVVITSPTYEGVISDIRAISDIAHRRGIPVLVDEAHGAHLGFSEMFPGEALGCGADITVTGLHKTLPALTQCSLLNIGGEIVDTNKIARQLEVFETSSPSYVLMASIDQCVRLLTEYKTRLFRAYENNIRNFDDSIRNLSKLKVLCHGSDALCRHGSFFGYDLGKIVVCAGSAKMTGRTLSELFRTQYGIEMEMAGASYAIAMTSICDTEKSFRRLADAIIDIDRKAEKDESCGNGQHTYRLPEQLKPICDALESEGQYMKPGEAAGAMSLEFVWAYPPGIPLIVPGEIISTDLIGYMQTLASNDIELIGTGGKMPQLFYGKKVQSTRDALTKRRRYDTIF